ncbi:MAG TPA: acyl carrier protein [Clostridia bacterium]|nr:acyl carrier protein [Clostridia bacterium]
MELLLDILEDIHPDVNFKEKTGLIDEGILDSFDIIRIVADIDEEFDVAIPPEEIIPENFNSAKSLYELIERLLGN